MEKQQWKRLIPHTTVNPMQQCSAHKRNGDQCGNPPMNGGTVCRMHGGSAPQVKKAAARRLLEELIEPALIELKDLLADVKTPTAVRLAAIRDILDRTGYAAVRQVEVVTLEAIDAEIRRLETELGMYDSEVMEET